MTACRAIRQNDGVPMTLAPGDVHVWCRATDSLGDADITDAVARLSPDERARYARFRFARDQRDYAAAHALLRTSLSRYADVAPGSWQFREAPGGKPSLVLGDGMPPLSFNLSHTHGLVACAIASGSDVGIDVESVDRDVGDGVAERFFSESENADLRQCASEPLRARRFIELWTLKEAYVKAIGKGLSHPLDSIVFDVADRESIRVSAAAGRRRRRVELLALRADRASLPGRGGAGTTATSSPRIQMMPVGDASAVEPACESPVRPSDAMTCDGLDVTRQHAGAPAPDIGLRCDLGDLRVRRSRQERTSRRRLIRERRTRRSRVITGPRREDRRCARW